MSKDNFHDISIEDIPRNETGEIKSCGIRKYVDSAETDVVRIIIDCFMAYLKHKGYKIVKVDDGSGS